MAKDRNKRESAIPLWEWIFAWIGFALVATTIGFLAYKAATGDGTPPDIELRAESVVPLERGYLVTVSASNRGDRTAADVKVEGELRKGAVTVEKSEMSFQYVPGRSQRTGGLYFTHDPRPLQLVIRAHGYEKP
ncbi:MAG TPA: hypothetical protein VED01_13850 [Burkholderiales bacterium]|nr:hypothetical protein [Burkholderiales bacterium]